MQPPLPEPGEGQSDRCELPRAHCPVLLTSRAGRVLMIAGSGLTDPAEEATGASLDGETPTVVPVVSTLPETERSTAQPKQRRELVPRPGTFKRANLARQLILKLKQRHSLSFFP